MSQLAALNNWTTESWLLDMALLTVVKTIGWLKTPGTLNGETKDTSEWLVTRTTCVALLHLPLILKFNSQDSELKFFRHYLKFLKMKTIFFQLLTIR